MLREKVISEVREKSGGGGVILSQRKLTLGRKVREGKLFEIIKYA